MAIAPSIASLPEPPGPRGLPLLGVTLDAQRNPLQFYLRAFREYGDIFRFNSIYPYYGYFVSHPDDVDHVLRTHHPIYPKGAFGIQIVRLLAGNGLLASEGDLWLRQRRLMQPGFHRKRLAVFADTMVALANDTADRWESAARDGQTLNAASEMMRLTLQIVGRTLFTMDIRDEANVIGKALYVALDHANRRSTRPLAIPEHIPTPRNRRYNAAVHAIDSTVQGLIDQRRRTNTSADDLLSMLLDARDEQTGEGMSDEQIRDEVRTLILAGHETTANVLSWAWYVLSSHPAIERNLHDELDGVLGGRAPTLDDLPRLPYTHMVIDETLRVYPPVWAMVRQSAGRDEIRGYRIEPNVVIGLSQYLTHRHPAFWDDPDRFDPERFTPDKVATRHKFAYFPFGGGPRLCIGNNFALMEAQLLLATLAQRFRLRVTNDRPIEMELVSVMRPKGGVPVRLEARRS